MRFVLEMDGLDQQPSSLLRRNKELEDEIERLRIELKRANAHAEAVDHSVDLDKSSLTADEVTRYSRQLLLPEWRLAGQLRVRNSRVLVVGAGGLGSPVTLYLAGAGIGTIGIVDYDIIEASNLHRQVIHRNRDVGQSKAASAARAINELNRYVTVVVHENPLTPSNAADIIDRYDIVADCTDNVPTRYLINDACVLLGKVLVSAAAVKLEGQLKTYNSQPMGVLGPVPGAIGCLQALEVLRIASGMEAAYGDKMLLFDGHMGTFRTVKVKQRDVQCAVCGETPSVTSLLDHDSVFGGRSCDKLISANQHPPLRLLNAEERMSCAEYKCYRETGPPHVLLDVRSDIQYGICSLPGSINVPLGELNRERLVTLIRPGVEVICLCRRGNQSQYAVKKLKEVFGEGM